MARKGGLTAIAIRNLSAKPERYEVPDPACPGLYLVAHPSGAKSWAFRYRFGGKSRKLTIGAAYTENGIEVIKIGDARDVADEARVSVARQIDPGEAKKAKQRKVAEEAAATANTVRAVAESYLDLVKHLRTYGQRKATFERLLYPEIGHRQIDSLKRSDIAGLLNKVAKDRGLTMHDKLLAELRAFLRWYETQSDDYVSPIVSRMARQSTKERARKRVLSHIELRALWRACDQAGLFGHYIRFTLLTASRRSESAGLRRSEISGNDWLIPGPRYKTKLDHLVPLSAAALAIIERLPKIGKGDLVFTTGGDVPMANWGERKEQIDRLMLAELRKLAELEGRDPDDVRLERWTLHDLRRSSRTLLTEAGVPSEHAERCLGHVIGGVEGTYNRYQYKDQKRAAFTSLAALVERIVATDN